MADSQRQDELTEQLATFGHPLETLGWNEGDPDYVTELGITTEDVPRLLAITRQWIDDDTWPEDEEDPSRWTPLHAWRALGQLRAEEAIPVLLEMCDPMDERSDDAHLEELPRVFALIGSAAREPLEAYLADRSHAEFARVGAASGLTKLALRHPEERDRVVAAMIRQIERAADEPPSLNGCLVGDLLDLEAREAAAAIERAFATGAVDIMVAGDWNEVREELMGEGPRPLHALYAEKGNRPPMPRFKKR